MLIDDERKPDPMVVDYRVRCEVDNGPFVRIYYGVRAVEYDGPGPERARDVRTDYPELSEGGRRRGTPARQNNHFFTEELSRHDIGLQGGGHSVRGAGPQDAGAGVRSDACAQAAEVGAGSGDRGADNCSCTLGYPSLGSKEEVAVVEEHPVVAMRFPLMCLEQVCATPDECLTNGCTRSR